MTAMCGQVVEEPAPGAPTLGKAETAQVHVRVCRGCNGVREESH